MSFRQLSIVEVRGLLDGWQAGRSARAIARESGIDRKTVVRYLAAAQAHGLDKTSPLTDTIVTDVMRRVQARPQPSPSEARRTLETFRPRIEGWLRGEPPLALARIHELLARDGVVVGYTTLRRFAREELAWRDVSRDTPTSSSPEAERESESEPESEPRPTRACDARDVEEAREVAPSDQRQMQVVR